MLSQSAFDAMTPEEREQWYCECHKRAETIKPRGPETYHYEQPIERLFFGFQRLAIVDVSHKADQPFTDRKKRAVLMCNGEIYNSKELERKYKLTPHMQSHSDCEVILHLYLKFGINKTLELLDGVFAFAIYDYIRKELIVARDPIGVRPLSIHIGKDGIAICSELKGLFGLSAKEFPNGTVWTSHEPEYFRPFLSRDRGDGKRPANCSSYVSVAHRFNSMSIEETEERVRRELTDAVRKRLQADRGVGCLLSGGLDSSLVASLVCRLSDQPVTTYSIGLPGATDLVAARKVAQFLETDHHEVIMTERQALGAIKNVVKAVETWDVTTIRASTPMYLLSQYIKTQTPDVKVIFSGEGADEVCQGYLYFHDTPTQEAGHEESVRILRDLCYFDVRRADRSISTHGLEARVPFLDPDFIDFYMSIPPTLRSPVEQKCEKWLLRKAFADEKLIPDEILWRRKDGFSDGCSSVNRPWYQVIAEKAEKEVSDEDMFEAKHIYPHCSPLTKEALWFRKLYHRYFPEKDRDKIIPYQWMPKWTKGDITNPSGRVLSVFSEEI